MLFVVHLFICLFPSSNYVGYDPRLNVLHAVDLLEEVCGAHIPGGYYGLFSIDVVSMFDKIPMPGVIGVISKRLSMDCSLPYKTDQGVVHRFPVTVSLPVLCSLIHHDCSTFNTFRYDSPRSSRRVKSRFISQLCGIPMGGNTSNPYAGVYMDYYISVMKPELDALGVVLVRKFVDDLLIYAPLRNAESVRALFCRVTQLDYTLELPVDGCLPFLDLLFMDDGANMRCRWYVL